jgi:hypothetical protein
MRRLGGGVCERMLSVLEFSVEIEKGRSRTGFVDKIEKRDIPD